MVNIPFSDDQGKALCDALGIEWEPGQPEPPAAEVVEAMRRLRAQVDEADLIAATDDVLSRAFIHLLDEYGTDPGG